MPRTILFLGLVAFLTPTSYAQSSPPKFELGGVFTTLHFQGSGIQNTFGAGGRAVYNPYRFLSLEAELDWTFPRPGFQTSLAGGRVIQSFAGAKAGLRKSRFGIFGKVRPGLVHFDEVIKFVDLTTFTVQLGSRTEFALDVGGIFEIYASRHWSVRWDVGDTMIHYGPFSVNPSLPPGPAETLHVFHFTSGVHFRF